MNTHASPAERRELLTEKVLRAVELVGHGELASYGDIAAIVGTGPRQVGQVMSRDGSAVCWWRITAASGRLPAHLATEARRHWDDEGIASSSSGAARIADHRADLVSLAARYAQATSDLG